MTKNEDGSVIRGKLNPEILGIPGVSSISTFVNLPMRVYQVEVRVLLPGEKFIATLELTRTGKSKKSLWVHRINSNRDYSGFAKVPKTLKPIWRAMEKILPS